MQMMLGQSAIVAQIDLASSAKFACRLADSFLAFDFSGCGWAVAGVMDVVADWIVFCLDEGTAMDGWPNTSAAHTHVEAHQPPLMLACTEPQSDCALRNARQLFERTLCCWTCDLLSLRRMGLNQTSWSAAGSARVWTKAA